VTEPSHRQRIILEDVRQANLRGRSPRVHANRDRNVLKAAGLIVGRPPNAPGVSSRGGPAWGWRITEKGLSVLAECEHRSDPSHPDDDRSHEVGQVEEVG
jgi:hypothetical protein